MDLKAISLMKRYIDKIFVVSGSWPPAICGVGDFMHQMHNELMYLGYRVHAKTLGRRDPLTALRLVAASYHDNQMVYLSYPTEGYGKSLWPFLLALGCRTGVVVHIHEYGSKNKYARFLLRRFQRLERIYFSNEKDFKRYLVDCGWQGNEPHVSGWRVMPSPSNISVSAVKQKSTGSLPNVVHFGQIRPNKGLEQLLAVFQLLDPSLIQCTVVGGVPAGYEGFADELASQFQAVGAITKINLSSTDISQALSNAQIGIFPFPDGADERRGSLIAALAHGVLCITTHSERTPKSIKDATVGVDIYGEALERRLADAILAAASDLNSLENLRRLEKGLEIGRNSSFPQIASALMSPYSAPIKYNDKP